MLNCSLAMSKGFRFSSGFVLDTTDLLAPQRLRELQANSLSLPLVSHQRETLDVGELHVQFVEIRVCEMV